MESKRQKQVGRLIQKDLVEIFQKDFSFLFTGNFVTVTDVKVSPDLSVAKVYLSFLKKDGREEILENIIENSKKIRGIFGNKASKQLRIIPSFSFFIDDTAEYAQKMDELINSLNIPPADPEEEI